MIHPVITKEELARNQSSAGTRRVLSAPEQRGPDVRETPCLLVGLAHSHQEGPAQTPGHGGHVLSSSNDNDARTPAHTPWSLQVQTKPAAQTEGAGSHTAKPRGTGRRTALPRLGGPVPSTVSPQAGTWPRATAERGVGGGSGDSSQTSPQEDKSGEEKHLELPARALHLPPQRPREEAISRGLQTPHWRMPSQRTRSGQEGN